MKKKLKRLLLSERGDSSYTSSFVYILVAVILIAFIINVFHIISVKQDQNHMSDFITTDQLVKQIQLNGGTSGETDVLFSFLSGQMDEATGLSYQVSGPGNTSRIQIGTPFYVTVTGRCHLEGFWKFNLIPINVRSQGAASCIRKPFGMNGETYPFSILVILTITMLMSFVLLFASVKIKCMNIRNAAKMELNNVSARIYADTFHSQREANLGSYMADLHLSSAYQEALRAGFINRMEERIRLSNKDYRVENISLQFNQYSDKIEYVVTCDAVFQIQMFGEMFPPITQHITLTGSHNTKY